MSEFDEIIDRTGTDSEKWEYPNAYLPEYVEKAPLPLWVADMDFKSPPEVLEALEKAVKKGIFGYTMPGDRLVEAVTGWQKTRHGWDVEPSWLLQSCGVVAALAMIIDVFSKPGDSVLIQPPVYGPFTSTPFQSGRRVITAPLADLGDSYGFDEKLFEAAIQPDTKLFVLCNPHNPAGKVWTREELTAMGEICLRHNVLVVADEIHQDLVWNRDVAYTPFAAVSPELAANSITCTAPSKTFNVAGLQTSNLFVPNPVLRSELARGFSRYASSTPNMLGLVACEAAYAHGGAWLDRLLDYLQGNRRYLEERIAAMQGLRLYKADSLYLGWIDFRGAGFEGEGLHRHLLTKAGVWLDAGLKFGREGSGFARINFGCPRSVLEKALDLIEGSLRS